jgi:deoxyadenosine/deoxycytidine kinase
VKEQKLILFVGPDRCGKTQIARELSRVTGIPYFKATSEHASFLGSRVSKNDQFLNQLRFADPRVCDLLKQTGHSVIMDRGFPCEFAYSQVLTRETDHSMLRYVDDAYASMGAIIVFCHRTSYVGITDDLDPSIGQELLEKLHVAYENFFDSVSKCRVLRLNVDDEDLDRETRDILEFVERP